MPQFTPPKKPQFDYKEYRSSQPTTAFLRKFYDDYDNRPGGGAAIWWRAHARQLAAEVLLSYQLEPLSTISSEEAETLYWINADENDAIRITGVDSLRDLKMLDFFNEAEARGETRFPASDFILVAERLLRTPVLKPGS